MTPEELQAADEAFKALQSRTSTLEATLQKYESVLDFMLANNPFFAELTKQLEERFLNVETQVATLASLNDPVGRTELTHTLATYRDDMLASMKAMMEVSPAKSPSFSPKFEAPAVFSGKREDWKAFQSRLELYFLNTTTLHPTDENKIMFAISRLGDTPAFKYMEKHIPSFKLPEEERPILISQLDVFFKSMSKTFGVTNAHVLAESARDIINRLEEYFTIVELPAQKWVPYAVGYLGEARGWWRSTKHHVDTTSWTDFKAMFLKQYTPPDSINAARRRLSSLRQGSRPVLDYITAFDDLLRLLPSLDPDQALYMFTAGLERELSKQLGVHAARLWAYAADVANPATSPLNALFMP
ncbi:hypothetical protein EC957_009868 [Mortierella hygrophila]|uniref:Retrotransposon gag domain-containing protein n=1 Tax=Mortierella hygrophila TaxID=979708 RepID=A0A9P6JXH9_9FUNG|nr:hypothetical protein EC957_009868 [Mortierella hygrophila]